MRVQRIINFNAQQILIKYFIRELSLLRSIYWFKYQGVCVGR